MIRITDGENALYGLFSRERKNFGTAQIRARPAYQSHETDREEKIMQTYRTNGSGALWNDFDENAHEAGAIPGLSLIQPEEMETLESLDGSPDLLARVLLVKAVFQGTILATGFNPVD